jgi:hypothetical protein
MKALQSFEWWQLYTQQNGITSKKTYFQLLVKLSGKHSLLQTSHIHTVSHQNKTISGSFMISLHYPLTTKFVCHSSFCTNKSGVEVRFATTQQLFVCFSGSATQRGLWPPLALQPSAGYGLLWLCSPMWAMASCGSAAQRGLWPPVALQPSAGYGLLVRGFMITHDAPQLVGLLWTSDQLVAETTT